MPVIRVANDFQVGLDYGQFALMSGGDDIERLQEALELALAADGISQLGSLVVVLTPNQWNFELPLRVEVWDGEPESDLDQWQHALEVHIDVVDGLWWDSPTVEGQDLPVPSGAYHVLITGRGFTTLDQPEGEPATDHWRLRLWPSPGPAAPRRLLQFDSENG